MELLFTGNKNRRLFRRMIEEDFKKGLVEQDKIKFRKLINADVENHKLLEQFKQLDRDLRAEGRKLIPSVDVVQNVAKLCNISTSTQK